MGDWKADQYVRMAAEDKYSGAGGDSDIYLWIVPAKVAGSWRAQLPVAGKPQSYELRLEQKYQQVSGTVRIRDRVIRITDAKLRGDELSFSFVAEVDGMPVRHSFSGRAAGDRMSGQASLSGKRMAARVEWTAERAARSAAAMPVQAERNTVH
jgi:hypothetical protein